MGGSPPPGTNSFYLESIVYHPSKSGVCTTRGGRFRIALCSRFVDATWFLASILRRDPSIVRALIRFFSGGKAVKNAHLPKLALILRHVE